MLYQFFMFLDAVKVPADELGKNWEFFATFTIILGVSPWLGLIVYLLFFKKYRIRYFVDGILVKTIHYKKKQKIEEYNYQDINKWYLDENCTLLFCEEVMPDRNLKLFAKKEDVKNDEAF